MKEQTQFQITPSEQSQLSVTLPTSTSTVNLPHNMKIYMFALHTPASIYVHGCICIICILKHQLRNLACIFFKFNVFT